LISAIAQPLTLQGIHLIFKQERSMELFIVNLERIRILVIRLQTELFYLLFVTKFLIIPGITPDLVPQSAKKSSIFV